MTQIQEQIKAVFQDVATDEYSWAKTARITDIRKALPRVTPPRLYDALTDMFNAGVISAIALDESKASPAELRNALILNDLPCLVIYFAA